MIPQRTLGAAVTVSGAGLHTGRRCRVTLHPAAADHGRRVVPYGTPLEASPMTWARRVPSIMSTSIALPSGRTVRTVEHLMAALAAYGVDNVLVEVDGPEIPILDGSARPWCRQLDRVGTVAQPAPRVVVKVRKPVQIARHAGFLRIEPAAGFSIDMTYSLVPDFPIMRWAGPLDRDSFVAELSRSRSFGSLNWRKWLRRPPARRRPFRGEAAILEHAPDAELLGVDRRALIDRLERAIAARDGNEPVLRGARPGRAALIVGRVLLPWPRYRDEPVRHVALDMIGDLALAGAPLVGRVTAHNPSHEKTYLLVAALMEDRSTWSLETESGAAPAETTAPSAPSAP